MGTNRMTSAQLIKLLERFSPDTEILVYDDGDGGYGNVLDTPTIYVEPIKNQLVFSHYYPAYPAGEGFVEMKLGEKKDETNSN